VGSLFTYRKCRKRRTVSLTWPSPTVTNEKKVKWNRACPHLSMVKLFQFTLLLKKKLSFALWLKWTSEKTVRRKKKRMRRDTWLLGDFGYLFKDILACFISFGDFGYQISGFFAFFWQLFLGVLLLVVDLITCSRSFGQFHFFFRPLWVFFDFWLFV